MGHTVTADGEVRTLTVGDHACWSYRCEREHARVVAAYLKRGLDGDERLAYFGPPDGMRSAISGLCDEGVDPDRLIESGRLIYGTDEEAYLPDGVFDPDARVAGYRRLVEQALVDGYAGLRVVGDAALLVGHPASREQWPGYEFRAELLSRRLPFTALCTYNLNVCDPESAGALGSVHAIRLRNAAARPEPAFSVRAGVDGSIGLDGEIDLSSSGLVRTILLTALPDVATPVLDLSGLRFADIGTIRTIAEIVERLTCRFQMVEVRGASPTFKRVWSLLRLDRMVTVSVN